MSKAWILLFIAGVFESAWAIGLKYSHGFSRPAPSAVTIIMLCASMILLSRAAQTIPIGTAYAVWVGIGAVGATVLGVLLFKEPVSSMRLFFLVLLVIAIVGLRLTAAPNK